MYKRSLSAVAGLNDIHGLALSFRSRRLYIHVYPVAPSFLEDLSDLVGTSIVGRPGRVAEDHL